MVLLMLLATTTKALWAVSGSCYIFLQDYLDHYPRRNVLFFFFFPTNISLPDQWAESLQREIQQVLELVQDKCWEHMMWERRKGTPLGLCVTLLYPFLWIIFWNQSLMQRKFSDKKIITNTHGYHNVFYHPRERRGNRTQNFLSKQLELYNYS